ncbi:MAG: hydroxymethylbilane synthase [Acidobacteria bacterium]|nr:hydroxymethylbilane synthase [Acidobacteriota bacterium]
MVETRNPQLVRIGTRGSELALWQAAEIGRRLRECHSGLIVEQRIIRTLGDRELGVPLSRIGDKGLFTRELEDALFDGSIDLAVHSLKDLPTALPSGLTVAAVLERDDPRDVLVARPGVTLLGLPAGSRLGTSSLRRRAQLLACRQDLRLVDVRGNLPTRVAKLDRGEYDGLVLARAGLTRLGLGHRIAEVIDIDVVLPAVGQGALGVETRADANRVRALLQPLDHQPTRLATAAERAFLARLEGGCQVPIGALGTWNAERLTLHGIVADLDGTFQVKVSGDAVVATDAEAAALGTRLAEEARIRGAQAILDRVRTAMEGSRP